MSDKLPESNTDIPWDRMSSEDAGKVAKMKAFGAVSLNFAIGVTGLVVSIIAIYAGQSGKDALQTQISALVDQVGDLSASNRSLTQERNNLESQIALIQQIVTTKDDSIALQAREIELLKNREKDLLIRIEELEKQIKQS